MSYNTMMGGAPSTTKVSTLQLQPMSVRQVALSDLAGDAALKNSFVITSDGAPGDVISNLIVLGGDGMQPVQLIGKDSQVNNGGGHPWNIDQGDRATVFLFNRSSSEELFNVNIVANGTRWHQEYSLKPAETKSIDIHQIVADQVADKNGNKLPTGATSGEVSWFTVDPGKGSGRVLISNAQSGLARNFSCGYNLVLCGSFLYNSVATFGIGADGYLGAISDYTCTAWANNACSGQQYDSGNGGYSYSWRSNSTGIAPITGSTTSSSGTFFGQATGTGTGTGQLSSQYCQSQSQGTNNVKQGTLTLNIANGTTAYTVDRTNGTITLQGNVSLAGEAGPVMATVNVSAPSNPSNVSLNQGQNGSNQPVTASQNGSGSWTYPVSTTSGNTTSGTITYTITLTTTDSTVALNGSPITVTIRTNP